MGRRRLWMLLAIHRLLLVERTYRGEVGERSDPASAVPTRPEPGSTAAFFDLDKTVIAVSSTLAFGRPLYRGGLIGKREMLVGTYAQVVYHHRGAGERRMERLRNGITSLCRGWSVDEVRAIIAAGMHELIEPLIFIDALELIARHRDAGDEIVIVSSSGAEVVEPIAELIGADHVIATRMQVEDGRYTGEISFYSYGPHKAAAIRSLAAERGYDLSACSAYSDSITDLPMLMAVGRPTAVNPDHRLLQAATDLSWPILRFNETAATSARTSAGVGTSAGAIAFALAAAGLLAVTAASALARRKVDQEIAPPHL
jgi:HAD superfamily hydrolase (TIGR01490 family)